MLDLRDTLTQSYAALGAHKMRVALTVLGLTMGVATVITVMTLVQGANTYVEQKIANLGSNVFQVARTPFAATDFELVTRALRYKHIEPEDLAAVTEQCVNCTQVGATASFTARAQSEGREISDVNIIGESANMGNIDTRTIEQGRFINEIEDQHATHVCLLGSKLVDELFPGRNPVGSVVRLAQREFTVIGTYEKIGSVLGQEQDNFAVIPLSVLLRIRGSHSSLTLNVLVDGGGETKFENAQDEVKLLMRARRHVRAGEADNFFIGTKDSYISLWKSISTAFFAVFIMVSVISAVVGGIVIMNVMLVSVTERTSEIGVRRAVGASQRDIRRQFLTESVMQCIVGGVVGVAGGFLCALALRTFTDFPAAVQLWVAVLGVTLSCGIGLFFGIYPAMRAARLDPVEALRRN
jgi:putative ABC transport system permease protein